MFAQYAHSWNDKNGPMKALHALHDWRIQWIDKHLPLRLHENCLDLGCATGMLCEDLAYRFLHVCGVDAAPELLEIARHRAQQRNLWISYDQRMIDSADFKSSPFYRKHFYQYIFAFEVLEHIQNVPQTLEAIDALLKPGGFVLISTFSQTWCAWFLGIKIAEAFGIVPHNSHDSQYFISPYHLIYFFKKLGYSVGVQGLNYNPLLSCMYETSSTYVHYFFWARKPLEA